MARELARLKLKIEGDTKGLRSSLKGAEDQAKRTGARMRRAFRRASEAVRRLSRRVFSLKGALIGLASAAALGAAIKRAIDFADTIGKTAKTVGLTAESLQILRFAARRSGVDIGQLDTAMIKLIKTVGELKTRVSSELDLAFRDFNPTLVANVRAAKDQEEVLQLVAVAIRDAATATDAAAIATGFFGRAGAVMVNIFRDGKFSAGEFEAAARRLGSVIKNETVVAAEAAADEIGDVADSLKAAATVAALAAVPAMKSLAEVFTDPAFQRSLRATVDAIGELIEFIARNQRVILAIGAGLAAAAVTPFGRLAKLTAGLAAGAAAFKGLGDEAERAFAAAGKAPGPFTTAAEVETTINLAAALDDLAFKAQVLRGDFDRLADGAPELARQIGVLGGAAVGADDSIEILSLDLRKLNDAMQELADLKAAVQLIEQTATAEEKRAMMIERINALLPTLIELTGSEARANEIVNRALEQTDASARKAGDAARELGVTFSSAFEDAVVSGKKFSEVLVGLERDIIRILARKAVTEPLAEVFTGLFASIGKGIFSAKGNVIAGGRVVPMQRGGIIGGPVAFPLRGGIGIAGETAPEAILPLRRLPSGDLGVGALRPGAVNITIVNTTGAPVETRESRRGNQGRDIEIVIGQLVSRNIRSGGETFKAVRETFNLAPATVLR